jgi:hypothetical protein
MSGYCILLFIAKYYYDLHSILILRWIFPPKFPFSDLDCLERCRIRHIDHQRSLNFRKVCIAFHQSYKIKLNILCTSVFLISNLEPFKFLLTMLYSLKDIACFFRVTYLLITYMILIDYRFYHHLWVY